MSTFELITLRYQVCTTQEGMNGSKSLYEVLDCEPGADKHVIRKAYQRLILAIHPDKYQASETTQSAHQQHSLPSAEEIIEAWSILGDDLKRKEYDHSLSEQSKLQSALSYKFVWKGEARTKPNTNIVNLAQDEDQAALSEPIGIPDQNAVDDHSFEQRFIQCPQCGEETQLEIENRQQRIECDSCSVTIDLS